MGSFDDNFQSANGERWRFVPPTPDKKEIFRELIRAEVEAGRLTPSRRARIVRYAAQLGLSAVEAGRLIQECQPHHSHDEGESTCILRYRGSESFESQTNRSGWPAIITGIILLTIWVIRSS